ncbi:MAG: glycerol-3-phosphate dehydrogenase C-terminal domain-containing protein [Kofleriaceae bacterium]
MSAPSSAPPTPTSRAPPTTSTPTPRTPATCARASTATSRRRRSPRRRHRHLGRAARAPPAPPADESAVSREHEIFARPDGAIVIAGGKLTTYRRMAKEAVDAAVDWLRAHTPDGDELAARLAELPRCTTKHRPLPGAQGLAGDDLAAVAAVGRALIDEHGLDPETATHLCGVYGTRAPILAAAIAADRSRGARLEADLPYVWAEIDFAVDHDLARTLDDVLARRVPLLLVGRDQGLDVAETIADRLASRLGWSADERAAQLAHYRGEVLASRRFRAG